MSKVTFRTGPCQKRENDLYPRVLRQFDAQSCTACGYTKLIWVVSPMILYFGAWLHRLMGALPLGQAEERAPRILTFIYFHCFLSFRRQHFQLHKIHKTAARKFEARFKDFKHRSFGATLSGYYAENVSMSFLSGNYGRINFDTAEGLRAYPFGV